MADLAQNEMRAKADMPEHVSSNEGLGIWVRHLVVQTAYAFE